MTVRILNFLHRMGFHALLCRLCQLAYFLKGYGNVEIRYHPQFRAYQYKVNGTIFLSLGPGWAYTADYLEKCLAGTYNHHYQPKRGDCIVDIGAGLGEETVVYAKLVGSGGEVHAIEANPTTYGGLAHLCRANGFSWVTPHHLAIYRTDGVVAIEDDERNYLTNTINSSDHTGKISVGAKTLDTFVRENNIKRIDFLKSNIEGAEQFMIEGMEDSIGMIRNFCISCHDFRHINHNHGEFYMTKAKVRAFLERHGFSIIVRNTGDDVVNDFIYAAKEERRS